MESNFNSPFWQETTNKQKWEIPKENKKNDPESDLNNVTEHLNSDWKTVKATADANISHPSHYVDGRKFEPKDVIRDWDLNFNLGSAVKYISRAGRKGDVIEDLQKAQQFIQFEIDALLKESEENG